MDTKANPKDSMKSTWRQASKDQWNMNHYLLDFLNAHPVDLNQKVPVHEKQDKVPYLPQWSLHIWVLFYAAIPLAIHQACMYAGYTLGPFAAFNLYCAAFNGIVIYQVQILRRLGHRYGFLDGDKHERDGVPDVGVAKVVSSLYKTTGSRLVMSIYLSYNKHQLPTDMNWAWLPLEIGLYGVVLDFWFYWYLTTRP